ncbi:MAG: DUF5696 domain-containing protein [bacterium]|jgi:hypothetical protein|nr:DUF5696 domain-containing protein [bacterium]MDD3805953.1 DUF5696 domain-containing protein [bacterium]MDD4152585.1 DUF5696 domain-containing protein [bacterium]
MENSILKITSDTVGVISVLDKRTGKTWFAGDCPIIIRCFNVNEDRLKEVCLPAGQGCYVEKIDSDSKVEMIYRCSETGIIFHIEYTLSGNEVDIRIPTCKIEETDPNFRLLSIVPLAMFGYTPTGQPGYMLLPNYSGVICRFDKNVTKRHGNLVYNHQSQWEDFAVMPVWGVVNDDSAFIGIVTGGEFDTEIIAELNQGVKRSNSVYPCFHYRYGKADKIDEVDRVARYCFLTGKDADYAGMARAYRDYLITNKNIRLLKDRLPNNPGLDYSVGAYDFIKVFCASKKPSRDGRGELEIYTTFQEVERMLDSFKEVGIEKASIILVGWNSEGHDGKYPTRLPVEPCLGGEDGLRKLIEHAKSLNYQITLHDNYADAYEGAPDWKPDDISKDRDGWLIRGGVWAGGQSYIICPEEGLKFAQRDLPKIKELGINGFYYLDAMVQPPRICFDKKHSHAASRRAYAEGVRKIALVARNVFGSCAIENNMDFMSDVIDGVAQTQVATNQFMVDNEFVRDYIDEHVPFYQIVYHGIIRYHLYDAGSAEYGDQREGLLREIEYGALPRVALTYRQHQEFGDSYLERLSDMSKQYETLCKELGYLQLELIENHRKIADGVFETTYSDGTGIIVDYDKGSYNITK